MFALPWESKKDDKKANLPLDAKCGCLRCNYCAFDTYYWDFLPLQ